jgi:hypothetical protein
MAFQINNEISLVYKPLKSGDYTITPFEINKRWKFDSTSINNSFYENDKISIYRAFYPENHKYFGNVVNISSSLYQRVFTTQSIDPKLLWYWVDNMFYNDYSKDKLSLENIDYNTKTYLAESSSIVALPVNMFGEGIKKESVKINMYSTSSTHTYYLYDDGYGNLIDSDFNQSNFINDSKLLMYLGFNENYRDYGFRTRKNNFVIDGSTHRNSVNIVNYKEVSYRPGIPTTDTGEATGVAIDLHGGYFDVTNHKLFNFRNTDNFAFSFWINTPSTQKSEVHKYNTLFSKNGLELDSKLDEYYNVVVYKKEKNGKQYPFNIYLTNSTDPNPRRIVFKQSSGLTTAEVTSSQLSVGTWTHVVCQKSSSAYQIWLNGVLDSSLTVNIPQQVYNDDFVFIASNGSNDYAFSGSMDEIRIYKDYLTSNEIQHLYNNSLETGYAYQTARVGNVFYKQGFITVSDPRPKYKNALLGRSGNYDYYTNDGFDLEFKNTMTLYEYEIICKIKKNEFNFTQNYTVRKNNDVESNMLADYVTSSYFNPYITTIGLYNSDFELVAIAKLANPTNKRDDVDMNFIIRFDM